MPVTATIGVSAALSLAAFPPTLGFIGKEAILDALLSADKGAVILSIALVLASIVFVAVARNLRNPTVLRQKRRKPRAPPRRSASRVYGWDPCFWPLSEYSWELRRL